MLWISGLSSPCDCFGDMAIKGPVSPYYNKQNLGKWAMSVNWISIVVLKALQKKDALFQQIILLK